jgi:hypothetical protein
MRKTMKVQTPALTEDEVAVYGPVVAETCPSDIKTYRLVPKTAEEMKSKFSLMTWMGKKSHFFRPSSSFTQHSGIHVLGWQPCHHV